jgi:SAM-dependent methyltransferase
LGQVSDLNTSYWQSAVEDELMQDEHVFVWRVLLQSVTVDLAGTRVLDVGCNRGGFLRLVFDERAIAEGRGYDPASAAIADARALAGTRRCGSRSPIRFPPAGAPSTWPSATRSCT